MLRCLCTPAALTLGLIAFHPANASERPFEVYALTTGGSLGPAEGFTFPVQVLRNTETCTVCTPQSTTCCTGVIRLRFEEVPAGVTACFPVSTTVCAPEITSDSPTALVQAGAAFTPGTYTLRLRATAIDGPNPRSHSASIPLTLLPFAIAAPSSVSVLPGGSQSVPLSIARIAAATGSIELALVDAADGLSGTFNPNPAGDNQSTLQLSATANVPTGNYFPSVRATLGNVVRNYEINVAVAPSFSLSLSPARLIARAGSSADIAVNLERGPGFTGAVALSLVGPRGFSGTFSPRGLGRSLRLSVAGNVSPGNYHVVVRGTAGKVTRNAGLRVTVIRPTTP
jgi:hypothetical protein